MGVCAVSESRTYGWNRTPEDLKLCVASVHRSDGGRFGRTGQCSRKRGHGPDGLYCKLHDPSVVQAKRDTAEAALKAKWDGEAAIRDEASKLARRAGVNVTAYFDPRARVYSRSAVIAFDALDALLKAAGK
jgi:hypothetical protein